MINKAIVLAGGKGTRLYPTTETVSKQLLPVYNKPMIYYPISTMMLSGIRDFLLISTPLDLPLFNKLLGSGNQWGISISYAEQKEPKGIAEAFLIGKEFIGDDEVALILGDNLFYGHGLSQLLWLARQMEYSKAGIFGYQVSNPMSYGTVIFDLQGNPKELVEKDPSCQSNVAIPGLYFYGNSVVEKITTLKPSKRGELEITDLNKLYLQEGNLEVFMLGRGVAWLDTGSPKDLLQASSFIEAIENRQGELVCSPEEIAYKNGWISKETLFEVVNDMPSCEYKQRLNSLLGV